MLFARKAVLCSKLRPEGSCGMCNLPIGSAPHLRMSTEKFAVHLGVIRLGTQENGRLGSQAFSVFENLGDMCVKTSFPPSSNTKQAC